MKIIVVDCANVRIDVLNVPENMVGEDVELFLVEHDYSLNNISWMGSSCRLCSGAVSMNLA